MIIFKKILISVVAVLTINSGANAFSIDYDELLELISDKDSRLSNVTEISNDESPTTLTNKELDILVKSSAFINLKKLDLSRQNNLTDLNIIELCKNENSFKQLVAIDLSDCTKITVESLKAILDSPYVGSVRNLPQISARYGCPASEIKLIIGGKTSIKREEKRKKYVLRPFAIEYKLPNDRESSFAPVKNGIKIINVKY